MASFYRREILQRALDVLWRKKFLLFFGFFAGLFAHGGEPDLLFRDFNSLGKVQQYVGAVRSVIQTGEVGKFAHAFKNFIVQEPLQALSVAVVTVLLVVIVVWLVFVSQAAVVRVVARTAEKKSTGLIDGLATGTTKFGALFVVNVITKLFTWGLWVIVAGVPAIIFLLTENAAWKVVMAVASIIVTLPISMIVSFITKYAVAAIALEDAGAMAALRKAWRLFRANWLVSVEVSVIIYLLSLAFNYVVLGVTLVTFNPVTLTDQNTLFISLRDLGLILVVLAVVHSIISTFSYAVWTIVYLRLNEGRAESKLSQWTTKLVNLAGSKRIPS